MKPIRFKNESVTYFATIDGKIYKPNGQECKIHSKNGARQFVRISLGNGRSRSFTVAKLVLLAFRPSGYKKGYVAIHIDNNCLSDNSLGNLKWGTRREQALKTTQKWEANIKKLHTYSSTVSRWKKGESGRTDLKGDYAEKRLLINDLIIAGYTNQEIAQQVKCSRSFVWEIRKRNIWIEEEK